MRMSMGEIFFEEKTLICIEWWYKYTHEHHAAVSTAAASLCGNDMSCREEIPLRGEDQHLVVVVGTKSHPTISAGWLGVMQLSQTPIFGVVCSNHSHFKNTFTSEKYGIS